MRVLCPRAPTKPSALGALSYTLLVAACGSGGEAALPGPPVTPVEAVTLSEKPVEQTTEFVGIVKSRRSTTVQPQVEGFLTRILVRSGDRVRPGSALMEIDPSMQQAAVANLESVRLARAAQLKYAQQEAARLGTLFEAGASSRSELEQAQTALSTAEAQLGAAEAEIREQRVALDYHRVTAPTAGVVGDVPVRVGDSVTRSTILTTIDQNAGLELYINVPVLAATRLRIGMPVHLVDERGRLVSTEKLSFVSPSVDASTQSVLAKASLGEAGAFRTEQFVRARVVWAEEPALTVPLVAVNRINGRFFVYLAERGEGGTTLARQRGVELGSLVGNDYVVLSGLKAGDRLVVSGVQKIGDGAPIKVAEPAPGAEASRTQPGDEGQ